MSCTSATKSEPFQDHKKLSDVDERSRSENIRAAGGVERQAIPAAREEEKLTENSSTNEKSNKKSQASHYVQGSSDSS